MQTRINASINQKTQQYKNYFTDIIQDNLR